MKIMKEERKKMKEISVMSMKILMIIEKEIWK